MRDTARRPSRHKRAAHGLLCCALYALLQNAPAVARADAAAEYSKAARTLLCDCGCSPQSVHDCACGRAAELRQELAAKVRSGSTAQQLLDEAVALHGEKILIAPTATGFNLFAWLGPGVALLAGIGTLVLVLRRVRRKLPAPAVAGPSDAPLDPLYVARLQRELRESE